MVVAVWVGSSASPRLFLRLTVTVMLSSVSTLSWYVTITQGLKLTDYRFLNKMQFSVSVASDAVLTLRFDQGEQNNAGTTMQWVMMAQGLFCRKRV